MTRYVAFLRAVNVGNRRITMADLAQTVGRIADVNAVSTYIASGNVLFTAAGTSAALEAAIEHAFEARFGFTSEAFVRTGDEVEALLAGHPFGVLNDDETHMVAFLKVVPTAAQRAAIEARSNDSDTVSVIGREVHWRRTGNFRETTLKPRDWQLLGQPNTNRNRTMLVKLAARL